MMMEQLENRRLMAGNVTAFINGAGALVVLGDNKSNDVQVATDFGNTLVVPVPGTTVNGGTTTVSFAGFPDVVINTGNGEDTVDIVDPFSQSVSINTGNGQDRVTVRDDAFTDDTLDNLDIDTGNGDDVVSVNLTSTNTEVVLNLRISTGNGADRIALAGDLDIGGTLFIDGGHGPDTLDLSGLSGASAGGVDIRNIENFI
jgi:hypothetical protein